MDIAEMKSKRVILDAHIPNAVALSDALELLRPYGHMTLEDSYRRGAIHRTPARTILVHAASSLPCRVIVRQRTPFGVCYVTLPDRSFDVDKNGKLLGAY